MLIKENHEKKLNLEKSSPILRLAGCEYQLVFIKSNIFDSERGHKWKFSSNKNKVVYCFIDSLRAWNIKNFCPYDLLQS